MGRPRAIDARFRVLADTLGAIVVSLDRSGTCDYASARFYEHSGMAPGTAVGRGYEAALHPDDVEDHRARLAQAQSDGAPFETRSRLRDADGSYRNFAARWTPIRNARGALAGWLGTWATVESSGRRAPASGPTSPGPTPPLEGGAELAGASDFLAALSHELRSPLSAVLSWCQMLRAGHLDRDQTTRALETIERNAKLEVRLIDDVLDVSRIESGKITLEMRAIEIASVISAAVEAARPGTTGRTVTVELHDDAARVRGEATRLQQIVHHLLSNALKRAAEGRIRIRTERNDSHVRLIVSDTGSGILREALPFIFDRFHDADSSNARTHGGLGLVLVRHLVQAHGGTVTAESAGPGMGTTVTVDLPLASASDGDVQVVTPAPTARSSDGARVDLRGVRVVIVDDDPDSLELMRTILAHRGATVATAGSATEAFDVLQQGRPDVLVSDIAMPDADGYALLRKVRAPDTGERGMVPAIAVTGYTSASARQRALAAGYQLHLAKPFEPDELIAAVARLTGRL